MGADGRAGGGEETGNYGGVGRPRVSHVGTRAAYPQAKKRLVYGGGGARLLVRVTWLHGASLVHPCTSAAARAPSVCRRPPGPHQ